MGSAKADSDKSSDAMSDFDSEASRVNFWKDINTKDPLNNALIMSKAKALGESGQT